MIVYIGKTNKPKQLFIRILCLLIPWRNPESLLTYFGYISKFINSLLIRENECTYTSPKNMLDKTQIHVWLPNDNLTNYAIPYNRKI